ncbi:MAG TPA: pitrilysin family protein [Gemmatimonadales bacterium]|nr:pitrilysin family protein [Gemmatimonadales bacterium]
MNRHQPSAIGHRPSAIGYPMLLAGVLFLAVSPTRPLAAQGFDRTKAPVVAAPPAFRMPAVQTARLPNGITIDLVEMHELPLVEVDIMIRGAGARMDGDQAGLATFTAGMLDEGAGTRDALGIASEAAYLGAIYSTGADWDNAEVELSVPKRNLGPALDLMADLVLRPRFSASEVQKQRDLRLANIISGRDDPGTVNGIVLNALLFAPGHPFHRPIIGDSASAARLDSAAVRGYYQAQYTPDRTTFVVTGDLTMAEARQMIAQRFGGWRMDRMARRDPPTAATLPTPVDRSTRIFLVDKPGAAQSVIALARPGVERSNPDYYAIQVMNTILGGSFSSRLNQNLRETKGWTYGAGSGFSYRPVPGPFTARASVRTDVTDSSLMEFRREIALIRDSMVDPVELQRAQAYLALGLPGDFETTGQMADQVGELLRFGLPFTWWNSYVPKVMAVTRADVQRVARQYLDPSRMTIVVVGDLAKIRAGVEATGIGPVEVRDVVGNPVP